MNLYDKFSQSFLAPDHFQLRPLLRVPRRAVSVYVTLRSIGWSLSMFGNKCDRYRRYDGVVGGGDRFCTRDGSSERDFSYAAHTSHLIKRSNGDTAAY
jgi:hypothetical protein